MAPPLTLVRCSRPVPSAADRPTRGLSGRHSALPNDPPDGDALSDDPAARRRELRVVLELCAAQARGARERAQSGRPLTLVDGLGASGAPGDPCD